MHLAILVFVPLHIERKGMKQKNRKLRELFKLIRSLRFPGPPLVSNATDKGINMSTAENYTQGVSSSSQLDSLSPG